MTPRSSSSTSRRSTAATAAGSSRRSRARCCSAASCATCSASETFPALTDVSFTVPKGSTYGVIGRNGSGKSTALKLVAGHHQADDRARCASTGRISALIELGAGFHPEISGRENVFINGIMLGLTKREIEERFDEIVEFAELREFIDAPVKTYSSGMYMRLGFAVAIHVNPDVLLVDEVLAVGDEGFTHKCLDKFAEFRRRGKTILLVTHSLSLVERFCDEALWLDGGRAQGHGDPRRVVDAYLTAVEKSEDELLATTTAKAVAAVSVAPPRTRRRRRRRPRPRSPRANCATCSRRSKDAGARARSRSPRSTLLDRDRTAVVRVSLRRSDVDPLDGRRASRRRPTSCSASACSTPTASAATAPTRSSSRWIPSGSKGEVDGDVRHREPRSRRRHLQARRRRPHVRRLSVRLPSPALHVPGEVAHARRRHLPAAPPLDVQRSRDVPRGRCGQEAKRRHCD